MELIVITILLLLNGVFAMFEIALVSARKSRLEEKAKFGNKGARIALQLLQEPEKILSAIQVGITLIGIVAGAYGGIALAEDVAPLFVNLGLSETFANSLALVLIVGFITYLSLIVGELVPKTLALNDPEVISCFLAPAMRILGILVYPVVWFLSVSTKLVLKLVGVKTKDEQPVTEEELKILLKQGSESGVIEKEESEIISEVMQFGDKKASHLMVQRMDVKWLDISASNDEILQFATHSAYSRLLVCDKVIDNIKGMVAVKDILTNYITSGSVDLPSIISEALFFPEQISAIKILEQFRKTKNHFGIVVDEYGMMLGIITLHDITENIIGDLPEISDVDEPEITKREDGSYLVDGQMLLSELKEFLDLFSFVEPHEDPIDVYTVGGLAMLKLQKVPKAGEIFVIGNYRFEILDMDGTRVDKVLVSLLTKKKPV